MNLVFYIPVVALAVSAQRVSSSPVESTRSSSIRKAEALIERYSKEETFDCVEALLTQTKKVSSVRQPIDLSMSCAYFARHDRRIAIDTSHPPLDKLVCFHHEAIHATTDYDIRAWPNDKNFAWGIVISSDDRIHASLPTSHFHSFQIDEMKAFRRTAMLMSQIAGAFNTLGDPQGEIYDERAEEALGRAKLFGWVAREIIKGCRAVVQDGVESWGASLTTSIYSEENPRLFEVDIELKMRNRGPITVSVPIGRLNPADVGMNHLLGKLSDVLDHGLVVSEKHLNSLDPHRLGDRGE